MYAGGKLSLAEEDFLGIVFGAAVDENGQHSDMHEYEMLKNDLFRHLYPLYVRNRDGLLTQKDAYGPIPPERRKKDAEFLQVEYQKWYAVIMSGKYNSELLQHLANETKKHLQDIVSFAKQAQYGSRLLNATIKEIVLHSKYLLYLVEEYYQELQMSEQVIFFAHGKVVVDSFAYIHTLFRHYSQHIKIYQLGKSYHFDVGFDHENLPNSLVDIITSYFRNLPTEGIEDDRIFVRVRGVLYGLWFRKFVRTLKGGIKDSYYRLQTFYPVTAQNDLLYAAKLNETLSDDGIILLHK